MDQIDFDKKEKELNTALIDDKNLKDGSVLSAMISEQRYQQWRFEKYDSYDSLDFPEFKPEPYRLQKFKKKE